MQKKPVCTILFHPAILLILELYQPAHLLHPARLFSRCTACFCPFKFKLLEFFWSGVTHLLQAFTFGSYLRKSSFHSENFHSGFICLIPRLLLEIKNQGLHLLLNLYELNFLRSVYFWPEHAQWNMNFMLLTLLF